MEPSQNTQNPQAQPSGIPNMPSSGYPIRLTLDYAEKQSRLLALFSIPFYLVRLLFLVPHLIAVYFLAIILLFASWFNFWVILFTGRSSKSLHDFMAGTMRWQMRVNGYALGLTDKYPPFRLSE